MPQLEPFRALRYDPRALPDLSAVVCPPYDVISPAERARLAARDERNAVHVELPVATHDADAYAAAGRLFAAWRSSGVLRRDDTPRIYVYEQRYRLPGAPEEAAPSVARGFFCRLRLEQPGGGVRRHEQTLSAPKEDRLRLLRAVRANLSPVLMLADDGSAGGRSAALLEAEVGGTPPAAEATDDGDTLHRLWPLDGGSPVAAELLALAGSRPLTIADGHHRYETALRYSAEAGPGTGADHVMTLVYDAGSGGLGVLPTHRLLHRVPESEALLAAAEDLFTLSPVADGVALHAALAAAGPGSLGLWTRHGGALLRARSAALAPLLPAGSAALRSLDVSVLAAALGRILGRDAGQLAEEGRLTYTKDAGEGLAQVADGRADACWLLAPTPVAAVLAVAAAGELMPPKSTYFVPKAATGLVFNPLAGD